MLFSLLLLLLSCAAEQMLAKSSVFAETGDKLEMAVLLFRHGSRSPTSPYPNDPHQEDAWPQGWGQLTEEGKRQEYQLGGVFKKRYVDTGYVSSTFKESQVYLRSTDYDRTLMSAQCVIANMFPSQNPGSIQDFNELLKWQSRTLPHDQDMVTPSSPGSPDCPAFNMAILTDLPIYIQIEIENEVFFDDLEVYTGMKVNVFTVPFLTDTLYIEYTNNLTMPDWFTVEILNKLMNLTDVLIYLTMNTDEEKRLTGGVWADTVLTLFESASNSIISVEPHKRLYVYSAHDVTVAQMLSVFGLYDGKRPPYSASFILELYSKSVNGIKDYYVKFLYHAETWSEELKELQNSSCIDADGNCPLVSLQGYMQKYRLTPSSWTKACQTK